MGTDERPTRSPAAAEFPSPWARSDRPVARRIVQPLEEFVSQEAGSGAILMVAAVPRSPGRMRAGVIRGLLGHRGRRRRGLPRAALDLLEVVNDLLMAVFFYVVALEVKREAIFGSLRDRSYAALPVAAAFGTMVGAAVIYLAINFDGGRHMRRLGDPDRHRHRLRPRRARARRASAPPRSCGPSCSRSRSSTTWPRSPSSPCSTRGGISLAWLGGGRRARRRRPVCSASECGHGAVCRRGRGAVARRHESGVHATIAGVVLGFLTPARRSTRARETGETIADQLGDTRSPRR